MSTGVVSLLSMITYTQFQGTSVVREAYLYGDVSISEHLSRTLSRGVGGVDVRRYPRSIQVRLRSP